MKDQKSDVSIPSTSSTNAHTLSTGLSWSAGGQLLGQAVRFATSVILARLLTPADFGLLGMATVITGFVGIFQTLGTTGVVIQRQELTAELLGTIRVINIAVGFTLSIIFFIGSDVVAALYGEPAISPIVKVLGTTFAIWSFGLVHSAILTRKMWFPRLMRIEVATAVIQGGAGIVLALLEFKVWALVLSTVLGSLVSTALTCMMSPYRARSTFRWEEVRKFRKFALNLTGNNFAIYTLKNTDKLLIGRFIGPIGLGFYSFAYNIYMLPIDLTSRIFNRVLFPAFSEIQDDDEGLRRAFLDAAGLIAFVVFPVFVGLFVIVEPFVLSVFGEQWRPIVPLIATLCTVGPVQAIAVTVGNIYLAKGRAEWLLLWNVGSGLAVVVCLICGLPWGVLGVVRAYAFGMIPLCALAFVIPFRLIDLRWSDLVRTVRPYLFGSLIMAVVVAAAVEITAAGGGGPETETTVGIGVGALTYSVAVLLSAPPAVKSMLRTGQKYFNRLSAERIG